MSSTSITPADYPSPPAHRQPIPACVPQAAITPDSVIPHRLLSATRRTGRVENDDRADWREAWALFPGEVAYVWHGALHATTVADGLTATGFQIRA
jgi:hypothetical protein